MLKLIPNEIRKIFIFDFFMGVVAFFLGLLLDIKEIYLAFCSGVIFSIISNFILLLTVYLLVYKSHRSYILVFRYLLSYIIYALSMYISYFFCKNIFAIMLNAGGLCSFKLICYCMYIFKFKGKKVHKE